MSRMIIAVGVLAGAIAVGGPVRADEQAAIDGCIDRIREVGGPDGAGGQVISSEYSEAGTLVMLRDRGGTTWRCLAANDGTVEDLSVADAADDGGGAMAGAGPAGDGPKEAVVHFPAGSSGTTLTGSITGREYFDYVLGARKGQTMNVSLDVGRTDGDGVVYFNILPPGSNGEAIFVGSMAPDRTASVTLPTSGDYRIRLYLMGNDRDTGKTVSYSLGVSIR